MSIQFMKTALFAFIAIAVGFLAGCANMESDKASAEPAAKAPCVKTTGSNLCQKG